MTAIILAGGKSGRFGTEKAFAKLHGIPMIEHQLRQLGNLFSDILIVTKEPAKFSHLKAKTAEDLVPHQAPLAGLYSGLSFAESRFSFVIACDLPLINCHLVKFMQEQCSGKYDAVVPSYGPYYEPLFAFYAKSCLKPIKEMLDIGDLRLANLYPRVKTRFITEQELKQFGTPGELFFNVNHLTDLQILKQRI